LIRCDVALEPHIDWIRQRGVVVSEGKRRAAEGALGNDSLVGRKLTKDDIAKFLGGKCSWWMKGWVWIGWWNLLDAAESEMKVVWILRAYLAAISFVANGVIW